MALFISVATGAEARQLGSFDCVEIVTGELRTAEGAVLARHIHHRWIVGDGEPAAYERLEVTGPAFVAAIGGSETRLGPYGHIAMVNGVFYADHRVFGFVDVQHTDVYLSDLGEHCKGVRLTFNRKG